MRPIGIDLGTTYTVVATFEAGRARVLPNAEGQDLTPSVVAFTSEGEPVVGEPAKRQAALNPSSTFSSMKRRMGTDYRARIAGKEYRPQDICSLILRKVKADAEDHLGERIDRAVITVPAYANDRQRQATYEAAEHAGLEVLRIINEPTAAALAYGLDREEAQTVIVWDLGGGTFDVSLLELGEHIFEVRAVSGDGWLGGDDFDTRLMACLAKGYARRCMAEFPAGPELAQRLREEAERAKIRLSSSDHAVARVPLPGLPEGRCLEVELTRGQFESEAADLFDRMAECARQALRDARLSPENVDRVLLVGGATRMPAVRELVRKVVGREPYRYIEPDKVVAMGAAIQAGMLLGSVRKAVLLDVLPLSLGVETQGGLMARIIPRNTPLPASEARIFTTAQDCQTSMTIHVLQGERELAMDNVSLGEFQLADVPSAARGVPKVEVAFEADVDGIVHVAATDLVSEKSVKVQIAASKVLDNMEIQRLIEDARDRAVQDDEQRRLILAGIQADNVVAAAEAVLAKAGAHPKVRTRSVPRAISQVKKALANGAIDDVQACTDRLRALLKAVYRDQDPLGRVPGLPRA